MKKTTILLTLVAATLSLPSLASEPVRYLHIPLDGLDLTTQRGVHAAQRRIDRVTAAYCRNDIEHLNVKARRAARECREALRREAMALLNDRRAAQLAVR